MNWFRQNQFLGGFLVALGLGTLLCLVFLWFEKGAAAAGQERLQTTVMELNRLRRSIPFPNEENVRQMKAQTDSYRSSLAALEEDMRGRVLSQPALEPNEFQSLLRQVTTEVTERAHTAKVRLPDNFYLGFNEYATSLPNKEAAPLLGAQLRAIEGIVNLAIDARVDALESLTRHPLAEEKSAPPTHTPTGRGASAGPRARPTKSEPEPIVASSSIELALAGSPTAVRRVLNQIAGAREKFYIIRTLEVHNSAATGPKRGVMGEAVPAPSNPSAPPGASPPPAKIAFIVGTEHLSVASKIEIVRFRFPEKGVR